METVTITNSILEKWPYEIKGPSPSSRYWILIENGYRIYKQQEKGAGWRLLVKDGKGITFNTHPSSGNIPQIQLSELEETFGSPLTHKHLW